VVFLVPVYGKAALADYDFGELFEIAEFARSVRH
jgi:hypothetical protein